jgi:hypothetical protein
MDVYSSDDHKLCDVEDVHGRYLVCKKGLLFTEEHYIPFSAVSDVREDKVYLNVPKDQLDKLGWSHRPDDFDQPYTGEMGHPGTYGTMGGTYGSGETFGTETTGHTWGTGTTGKFTGSHFRKGMDVFSSDDKKLCDVDDVYGGYLKCKKGMFFGEDAYVPFSFVEFVREEKIYLNAPKDQLDKFGWTTRPTNLGEPFYGATGETWGTQGTHTTGASFGTERMGGTWTGKFDASHFRKGMDVYGSDDQKVCTIDEVYSGHLMCKKGMVFGSDAYIPFSAVSDVREDKVYLNVPKDQLDTMRWTQYPTDLGQPYYGTMGGTYTSGQSSSFGGTNPDQGTGGYGPGSSNMNEGGKRYNPGDDTFGTGGTGETWGGTQPGETFGTGETWRSTGMGGRFTSSHFHKGMNVYGSDNEKVCDVDEVYNGYLLCKKGLIFKSDSYIPFSAISDVREDKIFLNMPKDQMDYTNWTQPPSDLGQPFYGEYGDTGDRPLT